jgi:hypothetical protein
MNANATADSSSFPSFLVPRLIASDLQHHGMSQDHAISVMTAAAAHRSSCGDNVNTAYGRRSAYARSVIKAYNMHVNPRDLVATPVASPHRARNGTASAAGVHPKRRRRHRHPP